VALMSPMSWPESSTCATSMPPAASSARPEFAPTLWFFRNTLVGDLLFTGVFALALEWRALRSGRASLLGRAAAANTTTATPAPAAPLSAGRG
jgi:hypothetical protein